MESIKRIEIEEIVKGIPGGFFIYYADGKEEIIYANQEVVNLFGCETIEEFREYTKNTFRGMVHPDDLERVEESILEQTKGNKKNFDYVEYRIVPKHGEIKWIEDFGHFVRSDIYGEVFYVFITDVTEKMERHIKQKRELIAASVDRDLLQKALESTVYAYFIVYAINLVKNYYRVIYPNNDGRMEDGDYSEAVAKYITPERVVEDEQEWLIEKLQPDRLQRALRDRDSIEYRYRRKKNDQCTVEWCVMVFTVSERVDGVPVTVTLGIRSIENLIQKENQQRLLLESAFVRARQASEAKSIFLANMSHDIRTPMNAIIGFAELGLRHSGDVDKMAECLEKIQESSRVLLRLIDDILDMSRIEADRLKIEVDCYDLYEIMAQVYQLVEKDVVEKNISYNSDFTGIKDRTVMCDFTRVKQVLYNLVNNAVKFTPENGRIDVTVRQYESLSGGIENYEFVVRDNGVGIPPDFLEKIFIPFEREKNTTISGMIGVGLGLPITRNIVELMHGTIEAESELGVGSTFTVCLPFQIVRPQEEKLQKKRERERVEREDRKTFSELAGTYVLLVEDNDLNREIARELLEEYHLKVDEAEDGDVALEMVREAPDKYDVILMDIQMPRMDGYKAARAIRQIPEGNLSVIPIIALSANAFEEDRRRSFSSGMNQHLSKPMDIEKVLYAIQRLTKEHHKK